MKTKIIQLLLLSTIIPIEVFPQINKYKSVCVLDKKMEYYRFSEGLAFISIDGMWGAINSQGKQIIPFNYYGARPFQDNLAAVSNERNRWGYINKQGILVIPYKYGPSVHNFSEGFAAVTEPLKDWGYIDKQGKLVIPYTYRSAKEFSEGLAPVKDKDSWCYIDKQGNKITKEQYFRADPFENGIAKVKIASKMLSHEFWIDKHEKIVKCNNPSLNSLLLGSIRKMVEEEQGEIDTIFTEYNEGLFVMSIKDKYGYEDLQGKTVIPVKYEAADIFSEGLACVRLSGKYGYIDKSGKAITPFAYESGGNFHEGMAYVTKNGKYGFINNQGEESIPFIFDGVDNFSGGFSCVEINGKCGFIDKNGNPLKLDLDKELMYKIGTRQEKEINNLDSQEDKQALLKDVLYYFEKAAIKGHLPSCHKMGYYYYAGLGCEKNYGEAVKWLTKAMQMKDQNGNTPLLLAYCYANGGFGITKNLTKAFQYYTEGAKYENENCYYGLAVCYMLGDGCSKNLQQACNYAEKLYTINKTTYAKIYATSYNSLAYDFANKKDFDNALIAVDKAISTMPNNSDYFDTKGEIYLMMGKEDEALQMWRKVLELNPKFLDDYPDGTKLYNGLKAKGRI